MLGKANRIRSRLQVINFIFEESSIYGRFKFRSFIVTHISNAWLSPTGGISCLDLTTSNSEILHW